MKKIYYLAFILLVSTSVFFNGCKKDDDSKKNNSQLAGTTWEASTSSGSLDIWSSLVFKSNLAVTFTLSVNGERASDTFPYLASADMITFDVDDLGKLQFERIGEYIYWEIPDSGGIRLKYIKN